MATCNNAHFHLHISIFKWKDKKWIRYKKVHSVRLTSLTSTWVYLYKTSEVNSEPSHPLYIYEWWYCICIPTLCRMQLPVSWSAPSSIMPLPQKVLDFLTPSEIWFIRNNSSSTSNKMNSQIKNKKDRSLNFWNY